MFLGMDVSTTTTGIAILDKDFKIQQISHIDLSKIKNDIYKKANKVRDELVLINQAYSIDKIFIEESLLRYSRGKSSIKTLMTLAKFNGIVSYLVNEIFGIQPIHILAPHARKICGIVITKELKKKFKVKELVFQQVVSLLKDEYKIQYMKSGKIKTTCYDEIDALVICKAGIIESSK